MHLCTVTDNAFRFCCGSNKPFTLNLANIMVFIEGLDRQIRWIEKHRQTMLVYATTVSKAVYQQQGALMERAEH